MSLDPYRIRRMVRRELDIALRWAAREGWNPGLHDADAFFCIDPGGLQIGYLAGHPVASLAAWRYSAHYAFLGLYIVEPEARGKGYGMALWQSALEYLRGCVIGLDAVAAREQDYRRSGFEVAWRNQRFQATGRGGGAHDEHLVRLARHPIDALAAYDLPFHPEPRAAFLHSWVNQRHTVALGWQQDGELRGYGVMRPCITGHKIGPLCADTPAIAEALFNGLCASAPEGDPIWFDVPEPNQDALALVHRHGLKPGFSTVRMYRGCAPALPLSRLYAITALEIG